MKNTLFLQSEIDDPYLFYAHMRRAHPVFRDEQNKLWTAYGYAQCQALLQNTQAHIPAQAPAAIASLHDAAATIIGNLVRLSNPPVHAMVRASVMRLFEAMQAVSVSEQLDYLLDGLDVCPTLDWVESVCKKLPALIVLRGYGFAQNDIDRMLPELERMTAIMQPHRTPQQVADLNRIAPLWLELVERHLMAHAHLTALIHDGASADFSSKDMLAMYASNLIGLLIQSYDATRGLLTNALLNALTQTDGQNAERDVDYWQKSVTETLRFDPPIHNTRRVLTVETMIDGQVLEQGHAVLIVVASANRDATQFERADQFDISRINNTEHLTFGAGGHHCLARHLAVNITVEALRRLFARYRHVELVTREIEYEPLVNARLAKKIVLALG